MPEATNEMATSAQASQAPLRPPSVQNGMNDINTNIPAGTPAPPAAAAAANAKKPKAKKAPDANETRNLLQAKINQLQSDTTGEQNEEQEIKREVKRATKDLNNMLSGISNPMERVDAVRRRNNEILHDLKKLEREHLKSKKRMDQIQKEKDAQRTELNKALGQKDKLEKLAREMTKDNKKLKEDLRQQEEIENRNRERMGRKDESLLADINDFIDDRKSSEEQAKYIEIEDLMQSRFKSITDQVSARELHFQLALRARDAELNHMNGRLEQQKQLYEKEAGQAQNLNAQVQTFSQTETELRSQLNIYVEKFKQVEDTLNNSNELFLTFRKEMEEMSKKTKRLEKENLNLTRKHDLNNRNIIEMAEDRTKTTKENQRLQKQIATLQSTIRQMQSQGRSLPAGTNLEPEDDVTESDYDSEEEYEAGSEEPYDDETEDDMAHHAVNNPPSFGPAPPPPPTANKMVNGHNLRGAVNGMVGS